MARVDAASSWIEGPRFDVAAFFVPACLGLAAWAAIALGNVSPVVLLWAWIALFDGPHMLAAYTRAYGDPALRRARPRLLIGSLSAFLVGPAVLLFGAWLGAPDLFSVFLMVMTLYSYHHVVRQHWGFVALYAARSHRSAPSAQRRALYLACWSPYVAFLLTHPKLREFTGVHPGTVLEHGATAVALLLFAAWLAVTLREAARVWRAARAGEAVQGSVYWLVVATFHGLLFFGLARTEPLFRSATNLDQAFMVLSIVSGVFHSAQYVALVGLYHVRSGDSPEPGTWFERSAPRALLVLVPFVVLYVGVASATGLYPGFRAWLGHGAESGVTADRIAIGIWWGFALQHYWLDERIWHVRSDARLRRVFGLQPT